MTTPDHHIPVENDCEDQGFMRIDDGCQSWDCRTFDMEGKVVRERLVKQRWSGVWYWVCPKCGGFYGEVQP